MICQFKSSQRFRTLPEAKRGAFDDFDTECGSLRRLCLSDRFISVEENNSLGLVVFGLIRDYIGYGASRLILMTCLITCYTVMYLATPGENDSFLNVWMLQFGAGVGLIMNYQQVSRMYPKNKALMIGILTLASQSS